MRIGWPVFLWLLAFAYFAAPSHSQPSLGSVSEAYSSGELTYIAIKSKDASLQGQVVRVGKDEFAVVGEMAKEEKPFYFYRATIPGRSFVKAGAEVSAIPTGEPGDKAKTSVFLGIRKIPFAPKRIGRITAVEEKKVLFDRGSLHQVRERDIYAVYDSSGRYKGKYEVWGVGDHQAIGKVYSGKNMSEGDRVVFLGQRKLFNLGFTFGYDVLRRKNPFQDQPETLTFGGGMVWSHTFPNGWGWETVFGAYNVSFRGRSGPLVQQQGPDGFFTTGATDDRHSTFILPVWIRKNFFYPRWFSPYLGAGVSLMWAEGKREHPTFFKDGEFVFPPAEKNTVILPAPVVGGGIELFPGKFFHPRLEARYFIAPSLLGRPDRPLYLGFGFLTSW